jgi:hypothetical protein
MIAKLVDSLLAQRAGNFIRDHRHSEAIHDGDAKVSWFQDGIAAILLGGQRGDETTRMRLSAPPEALNFALVGSCAAN